MARPSTQLRQRVLGEFVTGNRASAYSLALSLKLDAHKVREVCQNARRSGQLAAVGSERVAGSDRPAVVYGLPAPSGAQARAWHQALGFWDRA